MVVWTRALRDSRTIRRPQNLCPGLDYALVADRTMVGRTIGNPAIDHCGPRQCEENIAEHGSRRRQYDQWRHHIFHVRSPTHHHQFRLMAPASPTTTATDIHPSLQLRRLRWRPNFFAGGFHFFRIVQLASNEFPTTIPFALAVHLAGKDMA